MALQTLNTKQLNPKNRPGQGLLETVVALSILIVGAVTLMAVVVSASLARAASEYETIAANLAREGIELAVGMRNDNWMNDRPFDTGLYSGTDYTAGLSYDPSAGSWSMVWELNSLNEDLGKVYRYSSGPNSDLMVQGTFSDPQPLGTGATVYRRLLTFDPICSDGDTEQTVVSGSDCPSGTNKIGIRATGTVGWSERNRSHSISAIETIYDWR